MTKEHIDAHLRALFEHARDVRDLIAATAPQDAEHGVLIGSLCAAVIILDMLSGASAALAPSAPAEPPTEELT